MKLKINLRIDRRGKLGPRLFRVRERIGIAIVNPRGVANASKSVIVGK